MRRDEPAAVTTEELPRPGSAPPEEERRRAERVDVALQLTFRFGLPRLPPSVGTVIDLSSTGLFVHTARTLSERTRLAGALRAAAEGSPGDDLAFVGEVAWTAPCNRPGRKGPGFGVRFVHMAPAVHVEIRRLVALARR